MMVTSGTGHLSAHERYRLGWLDPDLRDYNQSSYLLEDTHKDNTALMIPIRYSGSDLKEYFLVENYQTTNSYSNANPFLTTSVFNHSFTKGILIYHVEDENKNTAVYSLVDIECADGLWNWNLATGSSTPTDRSDDLIQMNAPAYNSGEDERDFITINVGDIVYNDYMALTEASFGGNPPANHGRRYNSDDFLGDVNDFFEKDYVEVFSKWSNPKTDLSSGGTSNTGIQILNYNSSTHAYTLEIAVDENAILSMPPSKPQNLHRITNVDNHPTLAWDLNTEPDILTYKVYRSYDNSPFYVVGTVSHPTNTFVDYEINFTKPIWEKPVKYYVVAVDNTNKSSIPSDQVSTKGITNIIPKNSSGNFTKGDKVIDEYMLLSNYPNPFNPSTVIKYSLPYQSEVEISIYDIMGKKVKSLTSQVQPAGYQSVIWNGTNEYGELVSSGVYIYRFRAVSLEGNGKSFEKSSKLMLIK